MDELLHELAKLPKGIEFIIKTNEIDGIDFTLHDINRDIYVRYTMCRDEIRFCIAANDAVATVMQKLTKQLSEYKRPKFPLSADHDL
jgi:hypothetical protein